MMSRVERYKPACNASILPDTANKADVAATSTFVASSTTDANKFRVLSTQASVPKRVTRDLISILAGSDVIIPDDHLVSAWGIVPSNLVDPAGSCGAITVDYDAFTDQPNRCQASFGTCVGPRIDTVLTNSFTPVPLSKFGAASLNLDPVLPSSITVTSAVEVNVRIGAPSRVPANLSSSEDTSIGSHRLFAEPILMPIVGIGSGPNDLHTTARDVPANNWCSNATRIIERDPPTHPRSETRELLVIITVPNFGDAPADVTVTVSSCTRVASVRSQSTVRRVVPPASAVDATFELTVAAQQSRNNHGTVQCVVQAKAVRLPLWSTAGKGLPICVIKLDDWAFVNADRQSTEQPERKAGDTTKQPHQVPESEPLGDSSKGGIDGVGDLKNDENMGNHPIRRGGKVVHGDIIGVGTYTGVAIVFLVCVCLIVRYRRRRLKEERKAEVNAVRAVNDTGAYAHYPEGSHFIVPNTPERVNQLNPGVLPAAPELANDAPPLHGLVSAA